MALDGRLTREKRKQSRRRPKPSETFEGYFGPDNGIELPPLPRYPCQPVEFSDEDTARTRRSRRRD